MTEPRGTGGSPGPAGVIASWAVLVGGLALTLGGLARRGTAPDSDLLALAVVFGYVLLVALGLVLTAATVASLRTGDDRS